MTTKPGVQKPHCRPCASRNASCTVESVPSAAAKPSTVVTLGAVGLHREQQARAHGLAVEQDGARAADAVLAAEVRAGEVAVLAEEVGERLAGLGTAPVALAVDGQRDVVLVLSHVRPPPALGRECVRRDTRRRGCGSAATRGRRPVARGRERRAARVLGQLGRGRCGDPPSSSALGVAGAHGVSIPCRGTRWRSACTLAVATELDRRARRRSSAKSPCRRATSSNAKPAAALPDREVGRPRAARRRPPTSSTCPRRSRLPPPGACPRDAGELELGVERPARRRGARTRDRRARAIRRRCRGCGSGSGRCSGVARPRSGTAAATSASRSIARWRVIAPMVSVPFGRASTPVSSATRLRSTRCAKRVRRSASIGTRLWPPASGLASSACSARSPTASATVSGAWYSNGAGFTGAPSSVGSGHLRQSLRRYPSRQSWVRPRSTTPWRRLAISAWSRPPASQSRLTRSSIAQAPS